MQIISHGLRFNIEYSGFGSEDADRDAGIEAMQDYLDAQSADVVTAAHAGSLEWITAECDGDRPQLFDAIENVGHRAATNGWHKPKSAFYSVSAAE